MHRSLLAVAALSMALLLAAACGPGSGSGASDAGASDSGAGDAALEGSDAMGDGEGGRCANPSPAWDTLLTRVDTGAQSDQFPHGGFDVDGNAVVLWEQTDLASSLVTLWSATRSYTGTWSTPVQIDGTGGMDLPPHSRLAVAAGGSAIAVWEQATIGATWAVPYAAVYDGTSWGTPTALMVSVKPSQAGANLDPHVAILTNGDAIVAFAYDDGAPDSSYADYSQQIWVTRYVAKSWTPAGRLSSFGTGYDIAGTPDVAMTLSGDAIVVWDQNVGGDRVVVTRVAAGSTSPGDRPFVDAAPSTHAKSPQVAIDSKGNAMVVWVDTSSTGTAAMASYLPAGSLQGTPTPLDPGVPGPNAAEPAVGVDGNGDVIAAWRESVNDPRSIWADRFAGGSWQGAVAVETSAAEGTDLSLGVQDEGDAMLVWATGAGIKAALFDATSGSWGTAVVLNPQSSGASNTPDVAFGRGCPKALASWSQQDVGSSAGLIDTTFFH
jgi:hypothetical protein